VVRWAGNRFASGCEVDHIISLKHAGTNDPGNLAFACVFCNRHKGTDIASIYPPTGELVRLFNPREDAGPITSELNGAQIVPLTKIGEVTGALESGDPSSLAVSIHSWVMS